jgi:hypothetical protein
MVQRGRVRWRRAGASRRASFSFISSTLVIGLIRAQWSDGRNWAKPTRFLRVMNVIRPGATDEPTTETLRPLLPGSWPINWTREEPNHGTLAYFIIRYRL